MNTLPKSEESLWRSTVQLTKYPHVSDDHDYDVAIIGGGMAGLTTAYLLKMAGFTVAVIEKDTIGGGTSGKTTGKVTSQHNKIYNSLKRRFGLKNARLYAAANQTAIELIDQIIKREAIDCDWQRDTNYVFTENAREVSSLQQEAVVAQQVGLPATFTLETSLPFSVKGAVRFDNQAKLNAYKYMAALAKAIDGQNSHVYEHSRVTKVRRGPYCEITTKDGTLWAKQVVIATNVPFPLITHGLYCALEYPLSSYLLACKTELPLTGMYISSDKPQRSILPITVSGEDYLLIGGESHIPGLSPRGRHYKKLAMYANERFQVSEINYRWVAVDYLSYDGVPLVGKLYPWTDQIYVATAFLKWGLTNTTVAATIIRDLILKRPNPWAALYDSNRLKPISSIPRAIGKSFGITD